MSNFLKVTSAAALLAFASSAEASVIDLSTATNNGTTLVATDATFTAGAGTELFVDESVGNAACPLIASLFQCNGIMTLTFDFDVKSVTFNYGFGDPGDIAALTIFDGLGGVIGNLVLNSTAGIVLADLSSFGSLRSILFDNTAATGAGYAYGNISYEAVAPVPVPASLPLLLAGLGGIALLRRRKAA